MIKVIRQYLDLSINDVAIALNLDKQRLFDIETNNVLPSNNIISFYANKIGIHPEKLNMIISYQGNSPIKKLFISLAYKYLTLVCNLKRQ